MKDEKKVNKKMLTPRQKAIHPHPYISVPVLCLSIDAHTIGRISKQYSNFELHVCIIYPDELKLKKTSESSTALLYLLDIQITIVNGKYSTAVYDKRDYFSFKIVNFPYLCSNIPSRPAYGVYISQYV